MYCSKCGSSKYMDKKIILILLLLVLSFSITACGDNGYDDSEYVVIAEYEIEKLLKDPASAKFSWQPEVTHRSNGDVQVKSYVDAKNSFGGTVRTNFTVTFNGGDINDTKVETR